MRFLCKHFRFPLSHFFLLHRNRKNWSKNGKARLSEEMCLDVCMEQCVYVVCVCRAIRPKIILLCYRFRFNTLVRWWGRSRSFAPSPSRTNNNIIVFCGSILAEGHAFPSKRNLLLKKEWKGPLLGGGIETRVPWPGKSIIPKFYEFRISIFLEVSDFRFFAVF